MSKKYKKAEELVDRTKLYSIAEALELLPKISTSKFTGSVELTINFKLNEKQKKEGIRGSIVFPNSFGKDKKILVLTDNANKSKAEAAGADYAGLEDFIKKIESGWDEFDIVIATPSVMPQIAKLGKYLGRKGLMPNPKNQTVTNDLDKVIKMYKSGKKDFKLTESDSIQLTVGKLNMDTKALTENFEAFKKVITGDLKKFGPDSVKTIYMSPTMGPVIKIAPSEL